MKLAIYQNETTISVVTPVPECGLSFEEVCAKDVPTGVPYLVVDSGDIPEDRTFRDAWSADFSNPTGYGA